MKLLLTGASGFVGDYVAREFRSAGWSVVGLDVDGSQADYAFDICRRDEMAEMLRTERPEACVHLAAMSFVPDGWEHPEEMARVNLLGTINLLEAFRRELPSSKLLIVSTAHVYETASLHDEFEGRIHFQPRGLYPVSKLAADLTALSYARRYDMHVTTARPVNHIGPGQSSRFVVSSFARQLKDIAAGRREALMRVGNLASRRDFLDVRDVARAYRMILESGAGGEHYDLASGRMVEIGRILGILSEIAGISPRVEKDRELYRPTDSSPIVDLQRIRRKVGWEPAIGLKQSLRDIYDHLQ